MGNMILGDPEMLRSALHSSGEVASPALSETEAQPEDSRASVGSRGTESTDRQSQPPVYGLPTLFPRSAIPKQTRSILAKSCWRRNAPPHSEAASCSSDGRASRAASDASSVVSDVRDDFQATSMGQPWGQQAWPGSARVTQPKNMQDILTSSKGVSRSAAVQPLAVVMPGEHVASADARRKRPRNLSGNTLFRGSSSFSDFESVSSNTSASLGGRALMLLPSRQPGLAEQFGPAGVLMPSRSEPPRQTAAGAAATSSSQPHFRGDSSVVFQGITVQRSFSGSSLSSVQSGQRQAAVRVNEKAWPSNTDWHMYVFGGRGLMNRPVQKVVRLHVPTGPAEQLQSRPYCLALPTDESEELSKCTFRDTASAEWQDIATMYDSTVGIMATRCSRGIFVAGGSRPDVDKPVPIARILKTDSGAIGHTWTTLPEMPEGLRHAQAVYIPDMDHVQVLGGRTSRLDGSGLGVTNKVRTIAMSNSACSWVESTPFPAARFAFGATYAVQLGATVVAGGIDRSGIVQANTWMWDPRMPDWDTKESLQLLTPRAHFRMVYNGGYGMYAIGGETIAGEGIKSVEFLDLRRPEKWQEIKSMPSYRRRAGVAMAPGGSALFVMGGQRTWRPNRSSCDALFVDADVWAKDVVPNLPQVRGDCVAVWAPTTSSAF